MHEQINSVTGNTNTDGEFVLEGRLQNDTALQALRHTGTHPDLADRIEANIRSFDFVSGGDKETRIGFNNRFAPDLADEARTAIGDSLEAQFGSSAILEEDRVAAEALLEIVRLSPPA